MNFIQFCEAHGLIVDRSMPEGRWFRVRTTDKPTKRNGSIKFMGDHGFCQNHATMTEVAVWHSADATSVDPAAQAAAAQRMRQQREAERAARRQAIGGARRFWERARACTRLHPYLAAKGLSALGTQPLREADGLLVVPVMWRGSLISVQTISPDGAKRFWPGAPVKSGCVVLDRPRAALTVICEGLATGLAVFQAVRHARVVVAFDAGNLLPVVQEIRPTGSVVIAADNDHGTAARRGFNPGLEKARNAAELIGAGVAAPEGIEGTDWADALREWGPAGVKRIERLVQAGARYVAPQLENTS